MGLGPESWLGSIETSDIVLVAFAVVEGSDDDAGCPGLAVPEPEPEPVGSEAAWLEPSPDEPEGRGEEADCPVVSLPEPEWGGSEAAWLEPPLVEPEGRGDDAD